MGVTGDPGSLPRGGGGGGGSGATNPGAINLGSYMSSPGTMGYEATIRSGSNRLILNLPKGTVVLSQDSSPLTYVKVTEKTPGASSPLDTTKVVGLLYDMAPDGATFDPPVPVKISYNPATMPVGAGEEDLVIAYWDSDARKWVPVNESQVDIKGHLVIARISHFSTYAVVVYQPPALAGSTPAISSVITTSSPTPAQSSTPAPDSKPTSREIPVLTSAPSPAAGPSQDGATPPPRSQSELPQPAIWIIAGALLVLGVGVGFLIFWSKAKKS
jgi:hypothetical protein